ncbi:gamma-glutamyl-gamma-aminobutyrate hydrolase family protein [soil metagenome]
MTVVSSPLIALTGRVLPAGPDSWRVDAYASPHGYADALERAGSHAVVLPPVPLTNAEAADRLARFDGLVLTGGADVNPDLYGQEPAPEVYGLDAVVDEFELALVRAALDSSLPVLAICRGLQVLNVALGGTLDQHITGRQGLLPHGAPTERRSALHEVQVVPGSRLAKALGVDRAQVKSIHHQAVSALGQGLTVTARSEDGLIEGAETDKGWVVAVQWHPEETAAYDPIQQVLFDAFVEQTANA